MSLSTTIEHAALVRAVKRPRVRRAIAALIFVAVAIGATWAVWAQWDVIAASLRAMSQANGLLVVAGVGLVALRYWAAAVSLQAATPHRLPFGGTLSVQLATAAVGRLTPEAIGWLVLNLRFLQRAGLEIASATAAISLKLAAGALGRVAFALVVAWAVAADPSLARPTFELPSGIGTVALLSVAALLAVSSILLRRSPRARSILEPALRDLAALRYDPDRAVRLGASTLLLSVVPAATLAVSAAAVGIALPVSTVFAVYLVGSALAAASPTPGNLGALEATLSAGLAGAGSDAAQALAAVLIYRLLTFWLPMVPGLVAFRWAQRSKFL